MFDKILIANRGEIACRIARTCRTLGVATVAVYSEADADALHVRACDEAWLIGPAPARESYLDGERIIAAARASGAQAIHPGYGFLSENAGFARACEDAGIRFIGPPVAAIAAMGSKSAAKAIMDEAGVALVPGYHGEDQSPERLAQAADDIGYPVLIKASAGGGGKGMRRVDRAEDFTTALASARNEAGAAFGDERVLIERCLLRPRHVEVQVFADAHGNAVHLFERDCSVQRRHQKIIEEAPAPGLSAATRGGLGEMALAAAHAIGYVGAGTVEFIMDEDERCYFMEMNTRLQVEHPVTEMITGQDLVAWQLRVAAGEPLPCQQRDLRCDGHAFEARIYAEDAARNFLPASGRISHLSLPECGAACRVDVGVRTGDAITVHYDPMIAKLIVHGENRADALRRLSTALERFALVGVTTNRDFLARLAAHPAFAAGEVSTDFIERHQSDLLTPPAAPSDTLLAAATLAELLRAEQAARTAAAASGDPHSPWHDTSGWRLNTWSFRTLHLRDTASEQTFTIQAHYRRDGFELERDGQRHAARGTLGTDGWLQMTLDDRQLRARVLNAGERLRVTVDGQTRDLLMFDPQAAGMDDEVSDGGLLAPVPGMITAIHVTPGAPVAAGAPLLVLVAMKMEYLISAPSAGVVERIHYRVGEQVEEGAELLTLIPSGHDGGHDAGDEVRPASPD